MYNKLTKYDFLAFGNRLEASLRTYGKVSGGVSGKCAEVTNYDPNTGIVSGICYTATYPSINTTASDQSCWGSAIEVALVYMGTINGK